MSRRRSNPLINRDMGLLWAAQGLSYLGDQIFDTTLVVWIAAVLARGQAWAPLAVSGVLVAVAIPTLFIGPLAGVFVDRADRRRMLIATERDTRGADRGSARLHRHRWWFQAARRGPACIDLLGRVSERGGDPVLRPGPGSAGSRRRPGDARAEAQSLAQVNASVSTIIGPPLAVPTLFVLGIQWALIANALSFLISLSLIALVRARPPKVNGGPEAQPSFFRELREGFEFAGRNVAVRTLLVSLFVVMLGGGALNALDVFFVIHNLNTSANLYGFIGAAMGVGVLVGAVLAGRLAGRVGLNRMYWLSLLSFAVLLLVYARMTSFAIALVVVFVIGFPQAAVNVAAAPILMGATPRELLGRVVSLVQPITAIAGIISTAGAGFLATSALAGFHTQVLGLQVGTYDTIFSAAGVLILAGAIYAWLNLNRENASHGK